MKMLNNAALLLAVVVGIVACDPGGVETIHVDITGLSDEAAAEEIAGALCTWTERCGVTSIECEESSQGVRQCSGELIPLPYSVCHDEIYPDVLEDFQRVDLTAAEEQVVNDCINGMVKQDCITQGQLDQIVAALEAGEEPPEYQELPAACANVDIFFGGGPAQEPQPADPPAEPESR